jgi:histidine triad (HIT) family protein
MYSDDEIIAFKDIKPQAPIHILFVPKRHIDGADTLSECDIDLVGRMFIVIAKVAKNLNLEKGYRIVTNIGEDGGQTVRHLHFHLIGGEKLKDSF